MSKIIGSIVVFNPNIEVLKKTISTFLGSAKDASVCVWDNSTEDRISSSLREEFPSLVTYYKSPANWGFGKGHNEVFKRFKNQCSFFCVLNPDLEIPANSIPELVEYLESHPQYGLASGTIRGLDGVEHAVHKSLPTFWDYIMNISRRFLKLPQKPSQVLRFQQPYRIPIISGCFFLFTQKHYAELNGFDDRFFLYFEDYDISLRSYLQNKSIILPHVSILHKWARDSHKSKKLLLAHVISGLKFYFKWGFTSKLPQKVNQKIGPP